MVFGKGAKSLNSIGSLPFSGIVGAGVCNPSRLMHGGESLKKGNKNENRALQAWIRGSERLNKHASTVIISLATLTYLAAFYPGYLTADSIYMLSQSAGFSPISTWHSPTLVVVWGWLFEIFKSSAAPWLVQIAVYMYASWRVTRNFSSAPVRELTLSTLLLAPPIFTNMAALWKDCWVQAATLMFISLTIESFKTKSRQSLVAVLLSAVVVILIRPDYIIVIFPALLFLLNSLREEREFAILQRRHFIKASSIVIAVVAIGFLPNTLPSTLKISPLPINMIWDIAGMKSHSGTEVPGYNCQTSDGVIFGPNPLYEVQLPGDTAGPWVSTSSVAKDWLLQAIQNPDALFRHKSCVASAFFNLTSPTVHYAYPSPVFLEQPFENISTRSQLNLDIYWFFDGNSNGPLWRAGYYILLSCSLALLVLAVKRRLSFAFKIVFFSILGAAIRVVILPATDFRYALWIPVATIILIGVTMDSSLFRHKRSSD